uniref:Uncharacterized protein n=1 Tax=Arundo donax TaxID=35708 RepID=A0A0A9HNE4_ARUDO
MPSDRQHTCIDAKAIHNLKPESIFVLIVSNSILNQSVKNEKQNGVLIKKKVMIRGKRLSFLQASHQ